MVVVRTKLTLDGRRVLYEKRRGADVPVLSQGSQGCRLRETSTQAPISAPKDRPEWLSPAYIQHAKPVQA